MPDNCGYRRTGEGGGSRTSTLANG